jgi:uncharacterized membrane-anchored protein
MFGFQGARARRAVLFAATIGAAMLGSATLIGPARADGPPSPPPTQAEIQKAKGVTQVIPLGAGSLSLELRKGYAFVSATDVPPILQKLGVAAPSGAILGGVTAEGAKPGAKAYWISVVSEDPIGHVPETGAAEISSVSFLDSVQKARSGEPKLSSFAVTPSYAPAGRALVWGELLDTKTAPDLRHEQRLLGRDSVAGVTTIGAKSQLKKLAKAAGDVLAMISFAPGKTYGDFNSATDRSSEYDLPGLITGKRKAGPMAETAAAGGPPASAHAPVTLADFAPGGKLQLVSLLLGGIVVLTAGYLTISALRGRRPADDGGYIEDNPDDHASAPEPARAPAPAPAPAPTPSAPAPSVSGSDAQHAPDDNHPDAV